MENMPQAVADAIVHLDDAYHLLKSNQPAAADQVSALIASLVRSYR